MITKEQAMKLVGYNCKRLRVLKGLTQEQMQDFKVPYRNYQNIEAGKVNVTLQTLVKLADVFGVEVSELVRSNNLMMKSKIVNEISEYSHTTDSVKYILGSNKKGLNAF